MSVDISDMDHLAMELHIDTATNRFPSYPAMSACPSLASSFISYESSSPGDSGGGRRSSIETSEAALMVSSQRSPVRNSLSPMTPFSPDMLDMVVGDGPSIACTPSELSMPGMFQYHDSSTEAEDLQWMAHGSSQAFEGHPSALSTCDRYSIKQLDPGLFLSPESGLATGAALQSSLSRSIFHHQQHSDRLIPEHMSQWRPSILHTPPRTVAPSATFQPILPSSPAYHTTPPNLVRNQYADSMIAGAPSPRYSSSPLTSPLEQMVFVKNEALGNVQPTLVRTMRESKNKGSGRSTRRATGRKDGKRSGRLPKTSVSQSSIYPCFIEKNSFACNAEDCVDKNGKRKKFKRQEHLKRHQKTCHTGQRPHFCWVPGCTTKPFSRTDNLNSHLLKTHGKNSPAARNRYIATLDPKSGVFDLDYRGPFTESGWPIGGTLS